MHVVTPLLEEILKIQEDSGKYYWSGLAEILFRGAGFIASRTMPGSACQANAPIVFTRGVTPAAAETAPPDGVQFFEGPLHPETARRFGVAVTPWVEPQVDLFWGNQSIGGLKYPREAYRDPETGEKRPANEPAQWSNETFSGQFLDAPGWQTLMSARSGSGASGPVLVHRDGAMLCGLPIFDVAVRLAAFPPIPGKYFMRDDLTGHCPPFQRILDQLLRMASQRQEFPLLRIARWPAGYDKAFSIRHDYDRKISEDSARELLDFYGSRGVKCSIGFLSYLAPPPMIGAFAGAGHEIQLHCHARNEDEFVATLKTVSEASPQPVRGMTIHGGTTGLGFRGDIHYGWAERAGLDYVEMFSSHDTPVYPLPRIGSDGVPVCSPTFAVTRHRSLDIGLRQGENRFDELKTTLPGIIEREFLILMNHPDIHRTDLMQLVDSLDFRGVWRITQGEAVDWFRTTHFASTVEVEARRVAIRFPGEPAAAVQATITWPGGDEQIVRVRAQEIELERGGRIERVAAASVAPSGVEPAPSADGAAPTAAEPPPTIAVEPPPSVREDGSLARALAATLAALPETAHPRLREAVAADAVLALDTVSVRPDCGRLCRQLVDKWWGWYARSFGGVTQPPGAPEAARLGLANQPLAMLTIPPDIAPYLKLIGDKSRNMLSKARRAGYSARPFVTAQYLDDIYAINTSKEERGGVPMGQVYRDYPKPMDEDPDDFCPRHGVVNIGCFSGERLVAYCNMPIVGELGIVNRILGHGDHLRSGVMNMLVHSMVEYAVARYPLIAAINYRTLLSRTPGVDTFKKSVGFRSFATVLYEEEAVRVAGASTAPQSGETTSPGETGAPVEAKKDDATPEDRPRQIEGLAPNVEDHRGSGFRAALKSLVLPPSPTILDVGAGGFAGATTMVHLVDCFPGVVDGIEIRPERAKAVAEKFGDRVRLFTGDFLQMEAAWAYDLLTFDLDSGLQDALFNLFLPRAAAMLAPHGKVVAGIIYDLEGAYGGETPLLNPVGRADHEAFMTGFFGTTALTPETAAPALAKQGFAVLGLVDKWMASGQKNAIGWLVLEKLQASPSVTRDPSS